MKRRINILYPVSLLLLCSLAFVYSKISQEAEVFYGFTQSNQVKINFDKETTIREILVKPGQSVQKGQVLLRASNATVPLTLNNLQVDSALLAEKTKQDEEAIKYQINHLRNELKAAKDKLDFEIQQLSQEIQMNKKIYSEVKGLDTNQVSVNNPLKLKLEGLYKQRSSIIHSYNQQIKYQNALLQNVREPYNIHFNKMEKEKVYHKGLLNDLTVTAPVKGIVQDILCHSNEHLSPFTPMIVINEWVPNQVKSYIHESLNVHLEKGTLVKVYALYHPENYVIGEIVGLGTSIVEIPERLRKNPDFKTYGREIMVSIPSSNTFLQNEKVKLSLLDHLEKESSTALCIKKEPSKEI